MNANKSDSSIFSKILRNGVLILLLIIFISIVFNFRNRQEKTAVALISSAVSSKELSGVFIRNEEVRYHSGAGIISYKVADGGKLGTDTVIAEVYADDAQIGRNREIEKLTRELDILRKIQNPGTIESAQPSTLSESIEESYRSLIYSRDMGDFETLKKDMEDLLIDMSTYQIITKQVSGFSQQITDINAQLALLKSECVKPIETIKSPRSAYFVSYCDGYEKELTPDKLDKLTIAELNSITDRRSDDKQIVGKLIDGFGWYLAGVIDNSKKEYAIGNAVKLRFDSSAETFSGVIKDVRDEGDASRSIIIIECSQFNYDLVKHRVEKCEIIKGEYRGLKVPRQAIRFADITEETTAASEGGEPATSVVNYKGVYIIKGEQVTFKKIDVIYEGSDYVLSAVHEEDGSYLSLYDDIMLEGAEADG